MFPMIRNSVRLSLLATPNSEEGFFAKTGERLCARLEEHEAFARGPRPTIGRLRRQTRVE
jgi:hypothetical protein